ncbi:MAG TPA: exodeoxyribonuclease VII small subunit [Candidatus Aerophobetes bacterium]|nr:exodeoxyribonuclease VII small subunit [Candidatus Aerophobetes bacterium]
MEKLQKITQELEGEDLPLEEALQKFEEGMKLVSFCERKLEEAEKKIQVLTREENTLKLKDWKEEKEDEC